MAGATTIHTGLSIELIGSGGMVAAWRAAARAGMPVAVVTLFGKMLGILKQGTRQSSPVDRTQQVELILAAAGEGIYGLDLDGCTTFINPAAARMIGWETHEIIGRNQHQLLHHSHADGTPYPRSECPIYAAYLDGHVHHVTDEVFWRKDGSSFPVDYISTPIRHEGRLVGAVVTFRDITHTRRIEEQLRRSAHLASIGTFAAGIAHEINNPVGSIQLAAETALGSPHDARMVEEALQDIREEAQRCGRIVKSVLQFAREDTLEMRPGDLNEAARHAIDFTHEFAQRNGCSLETDLTLDLPPVQMNQVGIEQAIMNPLRNAVQAGAGRIVVSTRRKGALVSIDISDDGDGFTEDTRGHAFDPFYTTRQASGGTGLGLSVSVGIIEDHGGTIDIKSEPGTGSTLSFSLRSQGNVHG